MSMEYIRKTYNVPAKRGGKVKVSGRLGTIVRARGQYLLVRWADTVGQPCVPCHPTWQVNYLTPDGWLCAEPDGGRR